MNNANVCTRRQWNEMYDEVESQSSSLSDLRKAQIAAGLRPRNSKINQLLDAFSLQFAEFEKRLEAQACDVSTNDQKREVEATKTNKKSGDVWQSCEEDKPKPGGSSASSYVVHKKSSKNQDPDATSMSFLLENGDKVSPLDKSVSKRRENANCDSTDDEDAIFSPNLLTGSCRLKSLNDSSSKCKKTPSPRKKASEVPNNIQIEESSPTPDKHQFISSNNDKSEFRSGESKQAVRRQLNLESDFHRSRSSSPEIIMLPKTPKTVDMEEPNSFLEESIVAYDPTPPPQKITRPINGQNKQFHSTLLANPESLHHRSFKKQEIPLTSTQKGQSQNKTTSRLELKVTAERKKEKEVWMDLGLLPSGSSSSGRLHSKNKQKSYKQPTLFTVARNMPKTTVDLSTLKEFNGGSRLSCSSNSQSQQAAFSDIPTTSESGGGVKRKSDEAAEAGNAEKRDKTEKKSLSQVFCDISPIKISTPSSCYREEIHHSPSPSLLSHHSKPIFTSTATSTIVTHSSEEQRPRKPLSPGTSNNIMKKSDTKTANHRNSPQQLDFTYNLLKDFDKVPTKESAQPNFKYKEPTVRKKADRAKLQGWDCEECEGYYKILESQMDELEIQRIKDRCSRHRSKARPVNNTPENFWCTYIPSTEELYRDGYINVANTPFTPPPRRRRRNSDSEDDADENLNTAS